MKNDTIKKNLLHKLKGLQPNRADVRRIRILESCLKQLAEEPLEPLTLESVARRSGMRRSHVAYYFENAGELVWQALQYALSFGQEYVVQEISLATTPSDRLRAFVNANFHWFENHPTHPAAFAFLNYLAVGNRKYAKLNRELGEMAESRIEAILASGPLPAKDKPNLKEVAQAMRAYLVGAMARYFSGEKGGRLEDEKEIIRRRMLDLAGRAWREV